MKIKNSKGFTIIELLVVVAIIAVLAAIVLVNVTQYINQGKNAAIQGNMTTMLTNAAVFYDQGGSYTNFQTADGYTAPAQAVDLANDGVDNDNVVYGCNLADCTAASVTAWCSCSVVYTAGTVPASSTFCIDSTGYKGITQTACTTRCTTGAAGTNGNCQ